MSSMSLQLALRHELFEPQAVVDSMAAWFLESFDRHPYAQDPEAYAFFREQIARGFAKNFRTTGVPTPVDREKVLRQEAFARFARTQNRLAAVCNLPLPNGRPDNRHVDALPGILWRAREFVHWLLGDPDPSEIFLACRDGSGSSVGVPRCDSSLAAKWGQPRVTAECTVLLRSYLLWCGNASQRELHLGKVLKGNFDGPDLHLEALRFVQGSEADTVEKSAKAMRMITKEPSVNMFFQLGIGTIIARRLAAYGLDITKHQDLHRALAWKASVTRSLGTLDLSDASDSIWVGLVQYLLPPKWFSLLESARSHLVRVPGFGWIKPVTYSTMGNGFTFPLQTLIFHAITRACEPVPRHSWGTPRGWSIVDGRFSSSWSAYGDDIVVPDIYAEKVKSILGTCGFLVNEEKSFVGSDQPFRESCGGDFFRGRFVRPVIPKWITKKAGAKRLRAWLYVMLNQTFHRTILVWGPDRAPYMPHVERMADLACSLLGSVNFVPPTDGPSSGLYTFDDARYVALYKRRLPVYLDRNFSVAYWRLNAVPPRLGNRESGRLLAWNWLRNRAGEETASSYWARNFFALPPDHPVERRGVEPIGTEDRLRYQLARDPGHHLAVLIELSDEASTKSAET